MITYSAITTATPNHWYHQWLYWVAQTRMEERRTAAWLAERAKLADRPR